MGGLFLALHPSDCAVVLKDRERLTFALFIGEFIALRTRNMAEREASVAPVPECQLAFGYKQRVISFSYRQ